MSNRPNCECCDEAPACVKATVTDLEGRVLGAASAYLCADCARTEIPYFVPAENPWKGNWKKLEETGKIPE